MNIVEKKCPNCKSNLKFKPGEHEAVCSSCRREFAVEYDKNSDLSSLSAAEVELKPLAESILKHVNRQFEMGEKIQRIFLPIFFVIFIGMFAFAAFMIFTGFTEMQETRNEFDNNRTKVEKQLDDAEEAAKNLRSEYDDQLQEFQDEYNKQVESMNSDYQRTLDEMSK